jgi:GT2 family glycosyltransferase
MESRCAASHNGISRSGGERIRLDGKFLVRGNQRLRIQGVTYGPFASNSDGEPFPSPEDVSEDFARMQSAGINAIRIYHIPPDWLLYQADEQGISVCIDVPWPKHLCILDRREAQREARQLVSQAVKRGQGHPSALAYSIGNEIPANIVRWYGRRRIERFLAELQDTVKQVDAQALVTYANYPSTEYLELPFLDFATFNVYLHDPETFRRYLFRLQNLVGDRPLVLGEIGMDTLRHGEIEQAEFLSGHVREALLMGLAGAFIFSWTDEWHTGGHAIENWAFGITDSQRVPKASYHALREVFENPLTALLPQTPRVSVVVCSYNGGRTLEQCLQSLRALQYPDYEIIVVDDGSTDETRSILPRFPDVRVIHQANLGLSVARNTGLQAATGSIVAYTDSDCFVDPHWLNHLVYQFQRCDAAAVGGPNLTPEDGRLAACVAASPGQPTHVLESDQVAEHIPGCNMAFRRELLLAIKGFDPLYRKAGDDVDICWRLQQAGYWITFAPGAFVWHHRRQSPRGYLRQQAGYGEAEALLRFKHPDRFTGRGDGKWRGSLYGASLRGLRLSNAIIYRGTYGTGLFQCLYQPTPAHWAMFPGTLEWHLLMIPLVLAAFFWPLTGIGILGMLALSVLVALLQGAQAQLPRAHEGIASRFWITALCYAQPLVRSWARYRTRFFTYRPPVAVPAALQGQDRLLSLAGVRTLTYWSEHGMGRLQFLGYLLLHLNEHRWGRTVDSGWNNWDLEVYCHPWTVVQVSTVQEDHGGDRHLIQVRYRLRMSSYLRTLGLLGIGSVLASLVIPSWVPAACGAFLFLLSFALWRRGVSQASQAIVLFDAWADELGLIPCHLSGTNRADGNSSQERRSHRSRLFRWLDRLLAGQPVERRISASEKDRHTSMEWSPEVNS